MRSVQKFLVVASRYRVAILRHTRFLELNSGFSLLLQWKTK